ncbi:MAG: hypothetical protein AB8H12_19020 [Lewinella sp.]
MSSITSKGFGRTNNKSTRPSSVFVLPAEVREVMATLVQKAMLPLVLVGIVVLLEFSIFNDKLFFNELLVSSFIILALVFFKTSASPKK